MRQARQLRCFSAIFFSFAAFVWATAPATAQRETLRIGHFPNITHVQALVAHALSRQGKGWFEARLGPDVKIEWFVYNAGPSAIEAIFAKALDVTYVGPNPAINGHVRRPSRTHSLDQGQSRRGPELAREQLEADTRSAVATDLIAQAWARLVLTDEVSPVALDAFFKSAQAAGFLRGTTDLSRLVEAP